MNVLSAKEGTNEVKPHTDTTVPPLLNFDPHSLSVACAQIIQLMLDMAVAPSGCNTSSVTNQVSELEMDDESVSQTPSSPMCCNYSDKQFVLRRTQSAPCSSSDIGGGNSHDFEILSICPSQGLSTVSTSLAQNISTDSQVVPSCSGAFSADSTMSEMALDMESVDCRVTSTPSPLMLSARSYSMDSHPSALTLNVDCGSGRGSPVSIGSPARRIMEIRREESVDEFTREAAKERDITSVLNLSRSLDDVSSSLGGKSHLHSPCSSSDISHDKSDVCLETLMCSSIPSPVRLIDKLHHNRSLSTSPISGGVPISPKQRTFRRSSISPSNLRPSLLLSKRKLDPDDRDASPMMCTPAKKFFSPTRTNSMFASSVSSSNSSPDHDRVSDTSSNQYSGEDDSGSDPGFNPTRTTHSSAGTLSLNTLLTCDTTRRVSNEAVVPCQPPTQPSFSKLQYVAPPSPLATGGGNSVVTNNTSRKRKLSGTSYTFTPVTDD